MNSRPRLQRSPLALPGYPGYNDALWGTLLEAHVVLTAGDSIRLTQATAGKGVTPPTN